MEKIQRMKRAIGASPLVFASGTSPANVSPYLGHADAFLAVSAISRSWMELEPARVESLVRRVRMA